MSNNVCPDCGKSFPTNAPNGLCPACLLGLAQRAGNAARPPSSPESDSRTGEDAGASSGRIGRYKLLEIIGEGGFGTVWMAEQQEPVRRRVALKVIKLGMDTRQVVARFEAERQALALMDHSCIARVFDAGTTETGRPFFVMELVRGVPITEFCDARQLNTRERLELFMPVCQAVQHAHQKGVIHRDLKPSNILVTDQDGRPAPKIIDFGVAKAIEDPLTDKTLFTRFHQFLGTPAYMSPEQAGLGSLDLDTRSDIYSLGILLYELLTGQPPLESRQLREAGYEAILRTIREREPAKPSTRLSTMKREELTVVAGRRREAPQRLPKLVQGDLDWIVLKAIEKDRSRRYESAIDLAADLRRYLDNEPIAARPPSKLYRVQKTWRRNRLACLVGMAAVSALIFGLATAILQRRIVEGAARNLRASLYASEMNAAYHAWREGRMVQARELVDKQSPGVDANSPDLRGFDWRYLKGLTQPLELFTLTNATTWGLALSPDRQTFAGCTMESADRSADHQLRLWSLAQKRFITTLDTNATWIFSAAFSPDGYRLAVPHRPDAEHPKVQVWDIPGGRLLTELPLSHHPLGIAFSPDGKLLAASSGEMYSRDVRGEVCLWNLESGTEVIPRWELPAWVFQVAFSPDGSALATSCGDGVVRLWNTGTGSLITELSGHHGSVEPVTFAHDGQALAAGDEKGYLWVWDLPRRQPQVSIKAHDGPIYSVAFSSDDQRLLTASRDSTARLWRRGSAEPLATFAGHSGGVTGAYFLSGDDSVLTSSQDHAVKVWSTRQVGNGSIFAYCTNAAAVRFTSGGRFLARADWQTQWVSFFDPVTGSEIKGMAGQAVAATRDGKRLAVLHQTNVIFLDPIRLAEIGRISSESHLMGTPAFSPNGKWLAFRRRAGPGARPRTWTVIMDVAQQRVVKEIDTDDELWGPVFFARGGKLLLTVRSFTQETRIWDTSDWHLVKTLEGTQAESNVAALTDDGGTFAISGYDGRIRLWDLKRLESKPSINPNGGSIWALAFDPEGKTLAVATISGSIQLWNLTARHQVTSFTGHRSHALNLDFSPDGRFLASSGFDHFIRLWSASTLEEIHSREAGRSSGLRP